MQVLVLDPKNEIRRRAERALSTTGIPIIPADSVAALLPQLTLAGSDDVLIADLRDDRDRDELSNRLNERFFSGRTFVLIDRLDPPTVLGAERVLHFSPSLIDMLLGRLASRASAPPPAQPAVPAFHGLVGRSRHMRDLFARIEKAAAGDANVCIHGESGTGKELIAHAVHRLSDRRDGPLVTFDCTAVPEGLAESQLFGHVRGAFTGAIENREGVFAQANDGTLFIDELCELSKPLQAKLLRVVQAREFVKVGGTKTVQTNIRLITATNRDPKQAVDAGAFRADLYYRVAVVMIRVPSLRDRREDIPELVEHFVAHYATAYRKRIRGVQPSAMDRMLKLPWPGNVRQLENFLAQAVVLAEDDVLTERDLFTDDVPALAASSDGSAYEPGLPLREVERRHILQSLRLVGGNRTEAAKLLGISVRCLQYKLKAYMHSADTESLSGPGAEPRILEGRPGTP